MPVKTFRPLTPSTRYITIADFSDITKTTPEKSLVVIRKKTGGRNHYGRVTAVRLSDGTAVPSIAFACTSEMPAGGADTVLNVARAALQFVLPLNVKFPVNDPVDETTATSFAAGEVAVSCWDIV
jgi:hypothetical protein